MDAKAIDTNVLIVANANSEQASLECVSLCIEALEKARQQMIVLDDDFRILNEYKNKVSPSGQPGLGDAFLGWLMQNRSNPVRCEIVALTENDRNSFDEFPDDPELAAFDPSDHKFVAVAKASLSMPDILNAVDSDWWLHREAFRRNGISIVHLCSDQVTVWETKYPNQ